MRPLLCSLVVLCCAAAAATAGPNEGGVLWVHDTGLAFTVDLTLPPVSLPPAGCAGVDNEQPLDGVERIWKVYAAFPLGNSPRLKGTGWGIEFPEAGGSPPGYIAIYPAGCGLPDEDGPGTDFAIEALGFPAASGGEIGQSFYSARLTTVVELYYFTGFGAGEPVKFATRPHSNPLNRCFIDDATPQHVDPILGYSSLGFGQPGSTSCPAVIPLVACCLFDGSCQLTTPTGCVEVGGSVYGSSCEPNPCPQPGACCFPDGACLLRPQSTCAIAGGTFLGGPCTPNPCPQPGACCFPNGICQLQQPAACATAGGSYFDGPCTPNPCPQPPAGACCFADGTCSTLTPAVCAASGGVFYDGACEPNPCLQPGACCFPNGSCQLWQPSACASAGGNFLGGPCTPNPCPQPGACCFPDGTCLLRQPSACASAGGSFLGGPCTPNPCPQPPPPPTGACCFSSGACTMLTSAACASSGGTFYDGACEPNPCPQPGACCLPNGTCLTRQPAACVIAGGNFLGGPCTPNPCPQPPAGACCFADETCSTLTPADCAASAGVFVGGPCDPNPCSQLPPPSGCPAGALLEVEDNGGCNSTPNAFQPLDSQAEGCATMCGTAWATSSNRDTDWFVSIGIGGVMTGTATAGFPLQYILIYGTDCAAPSYVLGTGDPGVPVTLSWTVGYDAEVWHWIGPSGFADWPESDYVLNVCGIGNSTSPRGACCRNGLCIVISQELCLSVGGVFTGPGILCNPNPCMAVPTETTSWGAIKARFSHPAARPEGTPGSVDAPGESAAAAPMQAPTPAVAPSSAGASVPALLSATAPPKSPGAGSPGGK